MSNDDNISDELPTSGKFALCSFIFLLLTNKITTTTTITTKATAATEIAAIIAGLNFFGFFTSSLSDDELEGEAVCDTEIGAGAESEGDELAEGEKEGVAVCVGKGV